MKDHCSAAVLPAEQEPRLTDDLFVKDNSACADADKMTRPSRSEEHTSELQSQR